MADHPTSNSGPNFPPEPSSHSDTHRATGRPVYNSTLLPPRKRRRFSPWLIVPGLLLVLLSVLYFLIFSPKPRRYVNTAGTIVYACETQAAGGTHLWTARDDGSAARPLTPGAAGSDESPAFSADGSQIAFLSSRAGGQNQVWLMDGDGTNAVALTRGGGAKAQPAFAPGSNVLLGFLSGASLAVLSIGKGDASLLLPRPAGQSARPDSSDSAASSQTPGSASTVTGFAWQPASAQSASPALSAVLETNGIQALAVLPSLDASPRLTQNDKPDGPPLAAADSVSPAWSPDGLKIVAALLHVAGLSAGQKASGLILLDAQGNLERDAQGQPVRPLFAVRDPAIGPLNPVYSPDGSFIVFEMWRQPDLASRSRLGLFLVPAGGGEPKSLVKGDAGTAQFSRDGKHLFFLNRRPDGGHDLVRVSVDGTGLARISDGQVDVTGFTLSPQAAKS